MNDPIERQDAIDTLLKWMWPICINNEEVIESDDMVAVRNILKSLPPAQPKQRWTPAKESLPKKEGDYLVQCKYLEMPFIAWFGIDPRYPRGNNNCVQKFWCDDCEDDLMPLDDVIAWIPLPKPYKEEKS